MIRRRLIESVSGGMPRLDREPPPPGSRDQGHARGPQDNRIKRAAADPEDQGGVGLAEDLAEDPHRGVGDEVFAGEPARLAADDVAPPEPPLDEGEEEE